MRTLPYITGPLEAHGARSAEEYLERQAAHIRQLRAAVPQHGWIDPWVVVGVTPAARVSGGRWIVDCPCGNCPSASPDWNLAACFECGAIYQDIAWPKERERIEAILVARPQRSNRHWFPAETAAALADENARHQVKVPE